MKFQLSFDIEESDFKIQHGQPIVLLGSCFSDELESYFSNGGFEVISNPFGTLFHPIPIAQSILNSISGAENRMLERNGAFFTWDASTKIFEKSEVALKNRMYDIQLNLKDKLINAQVLIVTFGTAFGYRLNSDQQIVANCHKIPSVQFTKELSTVEEMKLVWEKVLTELKKINPHLKIVFTVSPVRHSKDGLIENNRSKSRLIELVHQLNEEGRSTYFPSYEIVNDELRDYRFFKRDLVHPNELAVEYVWNRFKSTYFNESTLSIVQQAEKFNRFSSHKPMDREEIDTHQKHVEEKKQQLLSTYPQIFLK